MAPRPYRFQLSQLRRTCACISGSATSRRWTACWSIGRIVRKSVSKASKPTASSRSGRARESRCNRQSLTRTEDAPGSARSCDPSKSFFPRGSFAWPSPPPPRARSRSRCCRWAASGCACTRNQSSVWDFSCRSDGPAATLWLPGQRHRLRLRPCPICRSKTTLRSPPAARLRQEPPLRASLAARVNTAFRACRG